jgi:hypothetical protein
MKAAVLRCAFLAIVATMVAIAGPAGRAEAGTARPQAQLASAYGGTPSGEVDLDFLEGSFRKTESMTFIVKLALKAELDGLIEDFRRHHKGRNDDGLEVLMARFEGLMTRTLQRLRGSDPALFRTLSSLHAALRIVLGDSGKFAAAMGRAKTPSAGRHDR